VWRNNTVVVDIALYVEDKGVIVIPIIVMSPTAVLNLHIKSYSPYFNIILAHTEL
jgi:hypothetical protein